MDVPEPPKIVLEQPAPCADARGAEELLGRALAPSNAPRAGWTVTVRVKREGKELSAEGEITDDAGAPVAHRAISKETRECGAIVRAVGVWASLVLDDEVKRAAAPDDEASDANAVPWPAPEPAPKPVPEQALFLKSPEERRDIELGAGGNYTYGLLGDGGAAIAGAHLFGVFEGENGWFWRPSLMFGAALRELAPGTGKGAKWGAARFDACRRMPGNYLERRGLQMDVCGGMEAGTIILEGSGQANPLLAPGGSLALRGELGGDFAAELRGMIGVNILRETILETPGETYRPLLVFARADIGLSWRIR